MPGVISLDINYFSCLGSFFFQSVAYSLFSFRCVLFFYKSFSSNFSLIASKKSLKRKIDWNAKAAKLNHYDKVTYYQQLFQTIKNHFHKPGQQLKSRPNKTLNTA